MMTMGRLLDWTGCGQRSQSTNQALEQVSISFRGGNVIIIERLAGQTGAFGGGQSEKRVPGRAGLPVLF